MSETKKHREFWLEKVESESGTDLAVWDFRPPFEAEFASCKDDFIHVVEASALLEEKQKVKKLAVAIREIYLYALDLSFIEETHLANLIEESYLQNEELIEKYGDV